MPVLTAGVAVRVQTRLFRKLGVRNRSGAPAVADAFGLLPPGALRPV